MARRGVRGNDGYKQRTVVELTPDLLIPGIPAAQLALVEPDFDTCGAKCLANPLGRPRVLRGVAQKYGVRNPAHGARTLNHVEPPLCARMVADAQGDGNQRRFLGHAMAASGWRIGTVEGPVLADNVDLVLCRPGRGSRSPEGGYGMRLDVELRDEANRELGSNRRFDRLPLPRLKAPGRSFRCGISA